MNILLAIPCYNCETQVIRLIEELSQVLNGDLPISEVCIIDNVSRDRTVQAVIQYISILKNSKKFSVYRNPVNAGLGGTHKIAFNLAHQKNCTHLMILHGDHQATPLDIPLLIANSNQNANSTVLGSRFLNPQLLSGYSQLRTVGNQLLNLLYSVATRQRVYDLGSGLNLFKLKDFELHKVQNFDNGFTFNMDLLLYLIFKKRTFLFVPIRWSTTDQVSNAHALKVGLRTLAKLIFWLLRIEHSNQSYTETNRIS